MKRLELPQRKWVILQAIVWDYVDTAEPVGSETLVQRYSLDVKPATVRHEMAEMLDLGYLLQPHTSAGRVPSDTGYRYYVDHLEGGEEPTAQEKTHLKGIQRKKEDLTEILEETCRVLARLTNYLAIASTVRNDDVFIRQAILSPVSTERTLMVLVLSNGQVENRVIDAAPPSQVADLQRTNDLLTEFITGQTLREISRRKAPETSPAATAELFAKVIKELKLAARSMSRGKTIHEGVANVLSQPEFNRDVGSLFDVLSFIDDEATVSKTLEQAGQEGATILIGSESGHEKVAHCSMVANRFFIGDKEAGVIGVLGPTRMRYETAISLVRYSSQLLTETLSRMFAN